MPFSFRSVRSARHRRIVSTALLVALMSALSSTTSAQSAPPGQEPLPQAQPQPAPSANAGVALGAAPPPAAYAPPPAYAQPAPGTVYAPPPGAPYAPPAGTPYYAGAETYRPRPRISRGLLIGGAITLGASYLLSATVGLIGMGESEYECIDCQEVGPWLLVPVIGPFIGAGQAVDGAAVIALLGVAQVVGLGLLVGGIIRFKNTKRRAQEQGFVFELRHNKTLALDVSTSPRFSGPELSLRF